MTTLPARLLALLGAMKAAVEAEEQSEDNPQEGEGAEVDADTLEARIEARFKELRSTVLRMVQLWQRDVLAYVCVGGEAPLHYPELREATEHAAAGLTYAQALRTMRTVDEIHRRLERNLPQDLVIGWGLQTVGRPPRSAASRTR